MQNKGEERKMRARSSRKITVACANTANLKAIKYIQNEMQKA